MSVMDLHLNDRQLDLLGTGTAIGTGILAWEQSVTAKFVHNNVAGGYDYGLLTKLRFADAVALTFGHKIAKTIFPDQYCAGNTPVQVNLFGAINKTSLTGAAILVADMILRDAVPEYKKMDAIARVVNGAGKGITVGGIIGGVFDPAPSGFTVLNANPVTGQVETGGVATGNVPFATAGSLSRMTVLQ